MGTQLYFGGCCYDEAMGYTDPEDHDKRIGCFRAAEAYYLRSAECGNAVEGLEFAVDNGEVWYGKPLALARAGVKRCRQETMA